MLRWIAQLKGPLKSVLRGAETVHVTALLQNRVCRLITVMRKQAEVLECWCLCLLLEAHAIASWQCCSHLKQVPFHPQGFL